MEHQGGGLIWEGCFSWQELQSTLMNIITEHWEADMGVFKGYLRKAIYEAETNHLQWSKCRDTQRHSATKEGHTVISPSLMDTQAYAGLHFSLRFCCWL